MSRQSLTLLALLIAISGWMLWMRQAGSLPWIAANLRAASLLAPQLTPIEPDADWPTFTHPTWGISFRHPPQWTPSIPDFAAMEGNLAQDNEQAPFNSPLDAKQMEFARTIGHVITLTPQAGSGWGKAKLEIVLSNYTLSAQGDLKTWVTLFYTKGEGGAASILEVLPLGDENTPATVDAAVHVIHTNNNIRSDAIWFSQRTLVHGIIVYGTEPALLQLANAISASMEFDIRQQRRLRESDLFAGDEGALRAFVEQMAPAHQPHSPLSPLATTAGMAVAAPTSPLVTNLQRFDGEGSRSDIPRFEVWYDAALWQLAEGRRGMNLLVHRTIDNCSLELLGTPLEATLIASHTLAGYTWSIHQVDLYSFVYRTNHYNWPMGSYILNVTYPDPLPNSNLFFEIAKSECRQQIEVILNSFVVLEPEPIRSLVVP